ncbi:MAG: hypothetical protein HYZ28_19760 [Myxococcales bacterium]|nr:hypothetical protein [Myxococcales bacterium]
MAGAAVFTTQPALDELIALRDWLRQRPDPTIENLAYKGAAASFYLFEGTYRVPNLQHVNAHVVEMTLDQGENV